MEFDDIEKILALVREHELAEFELERDGLKLRVKKAPAAAPAQAPMTPMPAVQMQPMTQPPVTQLPPTTAHPGPPAEPSGDEMELAVVKSPIVGTFYRSPEPGAPSFVEVGQHVKKDQVLCIIEAMKLMNEITSEYEGEIVSAYVENGKPVQYGERLFAIRTSA
jgi:acetyl-CoA carboxylase biotin carboxyl carrier protein